MDDKKTIKISLSTFICIIIIFILLLALVGVLFYYNFSNKNTQNLNELNLFNQTSNTVKDENNSSNEITRQNNIISTTPENNNSKNELKINESKDLVYDANYTYENLEGKSYEYYMMDTAQTCFFDDIIVPYININSEDAIKVNKEIEKIFENCAKYFKENFEAHYSDGYNISNYKYYVNNNILSVIITTKKSYTLIPEIKYYTYNFDLNTKKMIDYEDLYKKVGFSSDNISEKAENAIRNCSLYDGIRDDKNLSQYQNNSIQNYNKSIVNNTIKFFLDSSNQLNIIVTIEAPIQNGFYDEILVIK